MAHDADADPEALFAEFLEGVELNTPDDVVADAQFRDILRTLGCYDGMVRGQKEPELAKTMDLLGKLGRWVQTHQVLVEEDPGAYGGYDVSLVTHPGGTRLKVIPVSGFAKILAEVCERLSSPEEVAQEVNATYYGIPQVVVSKYLALFPLQHQKNNSSSDGLKLCSKCSVRKPKTEFHRKNSNHCMACSSLPEAAALLGPPPSQKPPTSASGGAGGAKAEKVGGAGFKVCSSCKVSKDYSAFSKDKSKPLGIRSRCHECEKLAWKKRGGANSRRMCLNCGEQKEAASFAMESSGLSRICKTCSARKQSETRQFQGPLSSAGQAMCAACLKMRSMDDFVTEASSKPFMNIRCRDCVKKKRTVNTKACTRCNKDLPMLEFHPDRYNRTGFAAQCKACTSVKRASRDRKQASEFGLGGGAREEAAGLGSNSGGRAGGRVTRSASLHLQERSCTNCGLVKSGDSFQPKGGDLPGQLGWCNVCYEFDGMLAKKGGSSRRAEEGPSGGSSDSKKCVNCGLTKAESLFPKEGRDGAKSQCRECWRKASEREAGKPTETGKKADNNAGGGKDPVAFLSGLFDSAQRPKGGQKRGASLPETSMPRGSKSFPEDGMGNSSADFRSLAPEDRKRGLVRNESGMLVKFCSGCKLLRGAEMYRKDKSKGTGLRSRCRICEGMGPVKKDPGGADRAQSKKAKKGRQSSEATKGELALATTPTSLNLAPVPVPDPGMPQEKICTCCRVLKPWVEFNKDNSKSSRLSSWCKLCTNSRVRSGRVRHRPSQRPNRPSLTPPGTQPPQKQGPKMKTEETTDLFQWETEPTDNLTSEAGADVTSPDSDCCLGLSPLSIQKCSKCGKDKATMDFYPNPGVPSGMFAWCKECCKVLDLMPSRKRKKTTRRLPRRRCVRCGELRTSLSFIKSIKYPNRVNVVCRHCNKMTRETRASAKKRRVKQGETELEFRLLVHEWKGLGRRMTDPGGGEVLWSELRELSSAESSPDARKKPFSEVTLPPYTRRKRRKITVDPKNRAMILSNAQKQGTAQPSPEGGEQGVVQGGDQGGVDEPSSGVGLTAIVPVMRQSEGERGPSLPATPATQATTPSFTVKVAEKQCMSCGVMKEAASFHRNRSSKSGLASWCIQCKRRGGSSGKSTKAAKPSLGTEDELNHKNEAVAGETSQGHHRVENSGYASDEPPPADLTSVGNGGAIKTIVSTPMDGDDPQLPGAPSEAPPGNQPEDPPSATPPRQDASLGDAVKDSGAEANLTGDRNSVDLMQNHIDESAGNGSNLEGNAEPHDDRITEEARPSSNPLPQPRRSVPDHMNVDTEEERPTPIEPEDVEMVDGPRDDVSPPDEAAQRSPSSDARPVDPLRLNRLVFDEEEDREDGHSDMEMASGDSSHDVDAGRDSGESGSLSEGVQEDGGGGGGEQGEFPNPAPPPEVNLIDLNSDEDVLGDDAPHEESEPSHDMLFVGERVANEAEVELPVAVGNAVNPMSDSFEESDESGSDNGGDRDSGEVDRWSMGGGRR
ncbi:hypothetical protein BSKO_08429 [Bryopsis sp. KO-2023]|nr:hypothetical protein BSKO_08429 [Bryopsis sp. KO-2023]